MASHHPVIIFLLSLVADQCGGVEIGVWGLAQRSVFGCGVEIGIGRRDRRWAWDVEVAVGRGMLRSPLGMEIAVAHMEIGVGRWVWRSAQRSVYGFCSFMVQVSHLWV
nr:hypothetical protein CFP56_14090 [Quercus suber]